MVLLLFRLLLSNMMDDHLWFNFFSFFCIYVFYCVCELLFPFCSMFCLQIYTFVPLYREWCCSCFFFFLFPLCLAVDYIFKVFVCTKNKNKNWFSVLVLHCLSLTCVGCPWMLLWPFLLQLLSPQHITLHSDINFLVRVLVASLTFSFPSYIYIIPLPYLMWFDYVVHCLFHWCASFGFPIHIGTYVCFLYLLSSSNVLDYHSYNVCVIHFCIHAITTICCLTFYPCLSWHRIRHGFHVFHFTTFDHVFMY